MTTQYRQGDIVLRPIRRLPNNLVPSGNKFSVTGETGNAHVMEQVKVWKPARVQVADAPRTAPLPLQEFVEVGKGGALMVHPEHPVLVVPPGTYRAMRVRSFTPSRIIDAID